MEGGGLEWDEGKEEAIVFQDINGAAQAAADQDSRSIKSMPPAWNMIFATRNSDQLVTVTENSFQG
jgi:hypothetical protein